MSVFAERKLECRVNETWESGSIRVFQPQYVPAQGELHSCWACRYEITAGDITADGRVLGVDSYQALELALSKLPSELEQSRPFLEGRLKLNDDNTILDSSSLRTLFHARISGDAR